MSKIDDIKQHAGSDTFRHAPKMPYYPFLRLRGNDGDFELLTKSGDKQNKENMAAPIEVIILRVRRRLADFASGESSSEANGVNDNVTVFIRNDISGRFSKLDEGTGKAMKEAHPELKTEQILYSLFDGKLVRFVVKGASLGSEGKPAGSVPLYDYLGSFKGGDEHVWMYKTILTPIKEKNAKLKKVYYALSFSKGEQLTDNELDIVAENMKTLHGLFVEQDDYNNISGRRVDPSAKVSEAKGRQDGKDTITEELTPTIQLDEEEIKAEDIPF